MTKATTTAKMEAKWEIKDRTYFLTGGKSPLTWKIQTKHIPNKPLLFWDEEEGISKEIRYATNQNSVFVSEQEGHVTLGHVYFTDGMLHVPRQKQALQKLLSLYHPHAGKIWEEYDAEVVAVDDIEMIELELEALGLVRELDIEHLEAIMRTELGSSVSKMSSKELKRDAYTFAKRNPSLFIEVANDEDIKLRNLANRSVENGILKLTDQGTVFKFASNGKKIFTVPFGENAYGALAQYFKTDEGLDLMKAIEKKLS